jgi:transposase
MAKNNNLSPAELIRLKMRFKALIVNERMKQKDAAKICGISEKTACRWMAELGLNKMTKKQINEAANKRDPDSLNAFIAWLQKKFPAVFAIVEPLFKQFLKPY